MLIINKYITVCQNIESFISMHDLDTLIHTHTYIYIYINIRDGKRFKMLIAINLEKFYVINLELILDFNLDNFTPFAVIHGP